MLKPFTPSVRDIIGETLIAMLNSPSDGAACVALSGEPGVGKSHFGKNFGKSWITEYNPDKHLVFYQCRRSTESEDIFNLFDPSIMVDAVSNRGIHSGLDSRINGFGLEALLRSQRHPTVLLIDELDKAPYELQSDFLDFLQSLTIDTPLTGRVKGVKKNLAIIITANFENEFLEALHRRWVRFILPFPTPSELTQQIVDMLGVKQVKELGILKIKTLVSFTYKYRDLKPQKKLVGNELVRILEMYLRVKDTISFPVFQESLKWHISPEEKDWKIIEEAMGLKYLAKQLWVDSRS